MALPDDHPQWMMIRHCCEQTWGMQEQPRASWNGPLEKWMAIYMTRSRSVWNTGKEEALFHDWEGYDFNKKTATSAEFTQLCRNCSRETFLVCLQVGSTCISHPARGSIHQNTRHRVEKCNSACFDPLSTVYIWTCTATEKAESAKSVWWDCVTSDDVIIRLWCSMGKCSHSGGI